MLYLHGVSRFFFGIKVLRFLRVSIWGRTTYAIFDSVSKRRGVRHTLTYTHLQGTPAHTPEGVESNFLLKVLSKAWQTHPFEANGCIAHVCVADSHAGHVSCNAQCAMQKSLQGTAWGTVL